MVDSTGLVSRKRNLIVGSTPTLSTMKAKRCLPPFSTYHGYTQTLPNGRTYVYLWNRKTNKRCLMSLARYRLGVKLGRRLRKTEEADHKDDDFTNDHPSNLQVLSRQANQAKEQVRRKGFLQSETPQHCICHGVFFAVRPRQVCSKECKRVLLADGRCIGKHKSRR